MNYALATSESFEEVRSFLLDFREGTDIFTTDEDVSSVFHWILPACQDGMTLDEIILCAGERLDDLHSLDEKDESFEREYPCWDSILNIASEMQNMVLILRQWCSN